MSTPRPPRPLAAQADADADAHDGDGDGGASPAPRDSGFIRRSWHAMTDLMSPFSQKALASLPAVARPARYTRADAIPDVAAPGGEQPTVRDYHAINLPPAVRVPKKIATPVKVEAKVWFANERTWVSYLNIAILVGTFSIALFNAAQDDITRYFSYAYAVISMGVIVYGYLLYQHRITLIRRRDPGHFDQVAGPLIISAVLFAAVLANFIIRVNQLNDDGVTLHSIVVAAFASS